MTRRQLDSSWVGETVSSGTLRTEDLIEKFIVVLSEIDAQDAKRYSDRLVQELRDESEAVFGHVSDGLETLLMDLWDVMDVIAPEGTYFGVYDHDAALFGFWRIDEEDEEDGDEDE